MKPDSVKIVGVTGTRRGGTGEQLAKLPHVFKVLGVTELHHGDCIGVDDQAADIAATQLPKRPRIVSHPPISKEFRAFNRHSDLVLAEKDYLVRNRVIVFHAEVLVVVPFESEHQGRGGTWYSHDHALKMDKPVVIIWPDGKCDWINRERL